MATLNGTARNDTLRGGNAADRVLSYQGDDKLYGNGGNDTLNGGPGNDLQDGGDGDDWLTGEPGNDILVGGRGTDTLNGSDGGDKLYGNEGRDAFDGGSGDDTMDGGVGGGDRMTGGAGRDTFVVDGRQTAESTRIADFERGDRLVINDVVDGNGGPSLGIGEYTGRHNAIVDGGTLFGAPPEYGYRQELIVFENMSIVNPGGLDPDALRLTITGDDATVTFA